MFHQLFSSHPNRIIGMKLEAPSSTHLLNPLLSSTQRLLHAAQLMRKPLPTLAGTPKSKQHHVRPAADRKPSVLRLTRISTLALNVAAVAIDARTLLECLMSHWPYILLLGQKSEPRQSEL
jgi:hypothetical protein